MEKVNLKDIQERVRQSPTGKFGRRMKEISVALGRDPESLDLRKRHPFDLTLVQIPKGKTLCPYHSHSAESELYLVVSGQGSIRDKDGSTIVTAGDAFFFGPGEAHQLANAGVEGRERGSDRERDGNRLFQWGRIGYVSFSAKHARDRDTI